MSAPPSPYIASVTLDAASTRKRDRPPALDLDSLSDSRAVSDGEVRYQLPFANADNNTRQVNRPVVPLAHYLMLICSSI